VVPVVRKTLIFTLLLTLAIAAAGCGPKDQGETVNAEQQKQAEKTALDHMEKMPPQARAAAQAQMESAKRMGQSQAPH
jgi:hypothetical protein